MCWRMRGESVLREPGQYRCGTQADTGHPSYAPCRYRHQGLRADMAAVHAAAQGAADAWVRGARSRAMLCDSRGRMIE